MKLYMFVLILTVVLATSVCSCRCRHVRQLPERINGVEAAWVKTSQYANCCIPELIGSSDQTSYVYSLGHPPMIGQINKLAPGVYTTKMSFDYQQNSISVYYRLSSPNRSVNLTISYDITVDWPFTHYRKFSFRSDCTDSGIQLLSLYVN